MQKSLHILGAPTSAGAYGPGQEKTPYALREAGLISMLQEVGVSVFDKGNISPFRWKVDRENKRAMNVDYVLTAAKEISVHVHESIREGKKILVLGGDCSIELGVVAGCLDVSENTGLIYIDLDTDLNTPESVEDGALDWMGVAHLLQIPGSIDKLTTFAKKAPMLQPQQIYFFANGNVNDFERKIIDSYGIAETPLQEVVKDPVAAARKICETWASQFNHVLIHLDVDVLDYVDFQLAENYRRNIGLTLDQLMQSLDVFLKLPNWSALTITEINPEHGEADGSTLQYFAQRLAESIGRSF